MTRKTFRTRHGRQMTAKDTLQGDTLTLVVVGRACSMGIDIVDI